VFQVAESSDTIFDEAHALIDTSAEGCALPSSASSSVNHNHRQPVKSEQKNKGYRCRVYRGSESGPQLVTSARESANHHIHVSMARLSKGCKARVWAAMDTNSDFTFKGVSITDACPEKRHLTTLTVKPTLEEECTQGGCGETPSVFIRNDEVTDKIVDFLAACSSHSRLDNGYWLAAVCSTETCSQYAPSV